MIDLQRRLQELGRIRLGDKQGNKGSQRKLKEFRLTSQSRHLLDAAAALYGGEVREWEGAPNEGSWELYTTSDTLDIAIPPTQSPYSQAYELWSRGGCQRRCDGANAIVRQRNGDRERACVCDPDSRECDLVTRVNFMLPRLPGLGVWRLESHGYGVAVELTAALDLFSAVLADGGFLRGTLRLEQRSKKEPGTPVKRFVVPVIDLDATMGELLSGQATLPTLAPALEPVVRGRPQLSPGPQPPEGGTRVGPADDKPERAASWGDAPPLPDDSPPQAVEPDRPAEPEQASAPAESVVTQAQTKRLWTIARSKGMDEGALREIVSRHHHTPNDPSTKTLLRSAYERVIEDVDSWEPDVIEEPTEGDES